MSIPGTFLSLFLTVESAGSTVVKHSPHYIEVEGSSPGPIVIIFFAHNIRIFVISQCLYLDKLFQPKKRTS